MSHVYDYNLALPSLTLRASRIPLAQRLPGLQSWLHPALALRRLRAQCPVRGPAIHITGHQRACRRGGWGAENGIPGPHELLAMLLVQLQAWILCRDFDGTVVKKYTSCPGGIWPYYLNVDGSSHKVLKVHITFIELWIYGFTGKDFGLWPYKYAHPNLSPHVSC